jgi:uncharacterized protein (TIGR00730 family)
MKNTLLDLEKWATSIREDFLQGFKELLETEKAITVFGSARIDDSDPLFLKVVEVSAALAGKGFTIITGGGPGVMKAANKGAFEAGGKSIGLNIILPREQNTNPYVHTNVTFRYFFSRKSCLIQFSQGFLLFPGGCGTLDELFEALNLMHTNKVERFPVVAFDSKYWNGLIDWMKEQMVDRGLLTQNELDSIHVVDTIDEVLEIFCREGAEFSLIPKTSE